MSYSSRVKYKNPYSKEKINNKSLTYNQFKGRFIKTNSRSAHDNQTQIITTQTLQYYYRILLANHFPLLQPTIPVIDTPFNMFFNLELHQIFQQDRSIDNRQFAQLLISQQPDYLPPLPSDYTWECIVPSFTVFIEISDTQYSNVFLLQASKPSMPDKLFPIVSSESVYSPPQFHTYAFGNHSLFTRVKSDGSTASSYIRFRQQEGMTLQNYDNDNLPSSNFWVTYGMLPVLCPSFDSIPESFLTLTSRK